MPHTEGPEEFFKVLKEVQQGKPKADVAGGGPPEPSPPAGGGEGPPGTLCLSFPAAIGVLVIGVLLVVLAYLVGWQRGWGAYESMLKQQAERPVAKATSAAPVKEAAQAQAPEVIDGMVFTLFTLGKTQADRRSVEKEAEYLNRYDPFKVLGIEAYAWCDGSGKHRLCARGLKSMDEPTRKRVRDQVRNLLSRQGRREYRDSDFLPQ